MIYLALLCILGILTVSDYISSEKDLAISIKEFKNFDDRQEIGKIKMAIYILLTTILIIISGFRYFTGFDYGTYYNMFSEGIINNPVNVEIGYKLLNEFIAKFFNTPELVFIIMAILILSIKSIVIKKSTDKIFFALLIAFSLYFLVGDMGQIRSTFAQSLDFLAMYLYIKNKKKSAFVIILFSVLFHTSSIIFLLMFFIKDKKYKGKYLIIIYIMTIIIGYFLNLHSIGEFSRNSFGFLGEKIYGYTNIDTQKIGISFNVIFDFMMLFFILFFRKLYSINNRMFNVLFNIYFMGICSLVLFNNYFVIGTRFANYFRLPLILLIPMLVDKIRNKKSRLFILYIFILIFSVMVIRMLMVNGKIFIPYRMNLFDNIITF